jgi:hypothetical protein
VLHPAVPPLFGEDGAGTDLRPVRELLLAGDRAGATARVPQPVADGFVAHGDADTCRQRLAEYRAAGVDLPVLFPMACCSSTCCAARCRAGPRSSCTPRCTCRCANITRIEEYLDSGKRSSIRAAREALSG